MAKSKQTYEEIRQKRMEENKKRMEELNIKKLSQSLLSKPSPVKKAKPRISRSSVPLTPARRSSRVSDRPPVSYKEIPMELPERPRRTYGYRRRDLLIYASDEVRAYAIERAERFQSGLAADLPSFIKPMVQSHVSGCFWLGLPVYFCKSHLPPCDEVMILEDDDGEEFPTKYLAPKTGLSGGWRGFAIAHELVDGDALVFQLVKPTRFKVHIVRAYDSEDKEEKENMEDTESDGNIEDNDKDSEATHLERTAKRNRPSRK